MKIFWKFIYTINFLSNHTIRYKFATSCHGFTSTTDIHYTLYVGYVKDDRDVCQYMFLSSCILRKLLNPDVI